MVSTSFHHLIHQNSVTVVVLRAKFYKYKGSSNNMDIGIKKIGQLVGI